MLLVGVGYVVDYISHNPRVHGPCAAVNQLLRQLLTRPRCRKVAGLSLSLARRGKPHTIALFSESKKGERQGKVCLV